MKVYKCLLFILLFTGCIRTTVLKNGYQKAAVNPHVYSKKQFFDKAVLSRIDTSVIYEEYTPEEEHTQIRNNREMIPVRLSHAKFSTSYYEAYRFYGNGCFNLFIVGKSDTLNQQTFNPVYAGWRGIFYTEKNKIKGDLITQVSGMGTIGKLTELFEFKGDTLLVISNGKTRNLFMKRVIEKSL